MGVFVQGHAGSVRGFTGGPVDGGGQVQTEWLPAHVPVPWAGQEQGPPHTCHFLRSSGHHISGTLHEICSNHHTCLKSLSLTVLHALLQTLGSDWRLYNKKGSNTDGRFQPLGQIKWHRVVLDVSFCI